MWFRTNKQMNEQTTNRKTYISFEVVKEASGTKNPKQNENKITSCISYKCLIINYCVQHLDTNCIVDVVYFMVHLISWCGWVFTLKLHIIKLCIKKTF